MFPLSGDQKMVEKYHHNEKKPANEDIAEIVFSVAEERIHVIYHTEDDKISSCTREFLKPGNTEEKGATIVWDPENHTTFQVMRNGLHFVLNRQIMVLLIRSLTEQT